MVSTLGVESNNLNKELKTGVIFTKFCSNFFRILWKIAWWQIARWVSDLSVRTCASTLDRTIVEFVDGNFECEFYTFIRPNQDQWAIPAID
jgi:hypothetical protein